MPTSGVGEQPCATTTSAREPGSGSWPRRLPAALEPPGQPRSGARPRAAERRPAAAALRDCARPLLPPPWTRRNRPAAGSPLANRSGWHAPRGASSLLWLALSHGLPTRIPTVCAAGAESAAPRSASGGELGAALAATGSEDRSAGAGAHPQAEAMRLGAATVVRLEGALAHESLFLSVSHERMLVMRSGGPSSAAIGNPRWRVTGMRKRPPTSRSTVREHHGFGQTRPSPARERHMMPRDNDTPWKRRARQFCDFEL
mgnify:CR=1 FL=1